jgi:SsrA-binding protein
MAKKSSQRRGHKTAAKKSDKPVITNRRASFDYALEQDIVAGLELTGAEVKAARSGQVSLRGAFVTVKNSAKNQPELYLINATFSIPDYAKGHDSRTIDTRSRKLLAHRREIDKLVAAKTAGQAIVPTKLLIGRFIKVVIALGTGKKRFDKRESIKRKDAVRENAALLKKLR